MLLDGESSGALTSGGSTTPAVVEMLEETGSFEGRCRHTAPAATGSSEDSSPILQELRRGGRTTTRQMNGGWSTLQGGILSQHVGWRRARHRSRGGQRLFPLARLQLDDWRRRLARSDGEIRPSWLYRQAARSCPTTPPATLAAMACAFHLPFPSGQCRSHHARGCRSVWMHQGDELYARLRGPGRNCRVSRPPTPIGPTPDPGGTSRMLFLPDLREGLIFHTMLGHDVNGLSCVASSTTLEAGTEWAAHRCRHRGSPRDIPHGDDGHISDSHRGP